MNDQYEGARKQILDHGYVQLVEHWGSDERIIEAARMSTAKGFLGWGPLCPHGNRFGECMLVPACVSGSCETKPGDEKLLRYLWENKHHTPFEMAGMTVEVQAPIFVFREWHRHRTQSYNELSARYTPLPDLNYVPTVDRLLNRGTGQTGHPQNKQAGTVAGAAALNERDAEEFRQGLMLVYDNAQCLYEAALTAGVSKELARVHLPVGRYSRMRASANLRNWLGFLTLRMAPQAQWEIRQFAGAVADALRSCFPRTMFLHDERAR